MNCPHSQRGFIALMSTIVIAAILLAMMASTGMASFYARFDALGVENKRAALALAESCMNVALLGLATSTDPTDYDLIDQIINIGTDARGNSMTCTIASVKHTGQDVTINTYASVDDSFSTIKATATLPPDIRIISWSDQ